MKKIIVSIGLVSLCVSTYANTNVVLYKDFHKNQNIKEIQKIYDIEKESIAYEKDIDVYKVINNKSLEEIYLNFQKEELKDVYIVNNKYEKLGNIIDEEKNGYEFSRSIINNEKVNDKTDFYKVLEEEKENITNEIIKNLNLATLYKDQNGVELTIINRCILEEKKSGCLQCDYVKSNTNKEIVCITTKLYKTK